MNGLGPPDNGMLSERRSELSSHEKTWRKLKGILLSERSQSEKAAYRMIPIVFRLEKAKLETVKGPVVLGGCAGSGEKAEHRGFLGQGSDGV